LRDTPALPKPQRGGEPRLELDGVAERGLVNVKDDHLAAMGNNQIQ
jgi:hypothetical protein